MVKAPPARLAALCGPAGEWGRAWGGVVQAQGAPLGDGPSWGSRAPAGGGRAERDGTAGWHHRLRHPATPRRRLARGSTPPPRTPRSRRPRRVPHPAARPPRPRAPCVALRPRARGAHLGAVLAHVLVARGGQGRARGIVPQGKARRARHLGLRAAGRGGGLVRGPGSRAGGGREATTRCAGAAPPEPATVPGRCACARRRGGGAPGRIPPRRQTC